jgi:hypothetical protein
VDPIWRTTRCRHSNAEKRHRKRQSKFGRRDANRFTKMAAMQMIAAVAHCLIPKTMPQFPKRSSTAPTNAALARSWKKPEQNLQLQEAQMANWNLTS